jgi:sugar-specific transcriptional regulator TrmB
MKLSPQSQKLYQILLRTGYPLSAKELSDNLHIVPASVYRLTDPLLEMGLITKFGEYPYQFTARSVDEGMSLFLLQQNEWFSQQFFNVTPKINVAESKEIPQSQQVQLSFIQSRDELMNISTEETKKTTKSIDLLRSGHDIPAHLMFELMEAMRRGVKVRMLVQDYSEENAHHIVAWKKNGIEVRKTPLRHVRLMIYDSLSLYFMSYKNTDSTKDLGMKISYSPFAVMLSQLFEQWWEKAEVV